MAALFLLARAFLRHRFLHSTNLSPATPPSPAARPEPPTEHHHHYEGAHHRTNTLLLVTPPTQAPPCHCAQDLALIRAQLRVIQLILQRPTTQSNDDDTPESEGPHPPSSPSPPPTPTSPQPSESSVEIILSLEPGSPIPRRPVSSPPFLTDSTRTARTPPEPTPAPAPPSPDPPALTYASVAPPENPPRYDEELVNHVIPRFGPDFDACVRFTMQADSADPRDFLAMVTDRTIVARGKTKVHFHWLSGRTRYIFRQTTTLSPAEINSRFSRNVHAALAGSSTRTPRPPAQRQRPRARPRGSSPTYEEAPHDLYDSQWAESNF